MNRLIVVLSLAISMGLIHNLWACGGDKIKTAQGNIQESHQIVPAVRISGDNPTANATIEADRHNSCSLEETALCPVKSSNKVQTTATSTENIQEKEEGCCSLKKDATSAKLVSPEPTSQPTKKGS